MPSPRPLRILEIETIRLLVRNGVLVICAGGGGIPVIAGEAGWRGIEAVIDKDHASALLARELAADALLMLTDVDAVYADWDGAKAQPLGAVSTDDLRSYEFAPGSMGPKVEAAIDFAEATGRMAGIGRLEDAAAILRGEAGTRIASPPISDNVGTYWSAVSMSFSPRALRAARSASRLSIQSGSISGTDDNSRSV